MSFVNLYVQTEYSLLSSAISLNRLFDYAQDNNIKCLAICDNDMYGVYKFYQGCKARDIKPILGLCLNLGSKDNKDNILLFAYNNEGYTNLCKLSSIKQIEGFGEDKYAILSKHSRGIIAILPGCEASILKASDNEEIVDNILFLKGIFDYFYIGLMGVSKYDKEIFGNLYVLCKSNNIKMVALHKTLFLNQDDLELYKTIKLISLISANQKEYECSERENSAIYLNEELADNIFANYPDLLEESYEIANICNVNIDNNNYHFPKYHLPDGKDVDSKKYLEDLAKVGLNKRLKGKKLDNELIDEYKNRLLYELSIINKMGFSDYFLIVYDYVRFAKESGILVGPGRGSAAGSLVSYVLGITNIDPIEYNLLFERFLNPERVTMPDIDVDFPDDAREAIYQYLITRYGAKQVAHIGTFGTFKPRSAIRDVGKVLGFKDNVISLINNYIPQYNSPSLDKIASGVVDIKKMISGNSEIKKLFGLAQRIENMPRNVSTHASGVVIGDVDLDLYTPLAPGLNGVYQTQYEASDIEDIGLVKMDILSLSNLNTITKIVKEVNDKKGISIDINKISLDDPNVFRLMASGDTDGIFQFESKGMRKLLKDLKVASLEDMIIANAIYRPGPQEMIPTFLKRKEGAKYQGLDESIDEILKPTYGIIVFQEQVMLIAQKYAGFTLGEADLLRRAISKKKADTLFKMREAFISGSLKCGHNNDDANKIYDYIVKFGDYGFNRSHAVVYSVVAYQMAYLKTYYYPFFMSVLMESSIGDKEKIANYFANLRSRKFVILPPDINISSTTFEVRENLVYYPLQGIRDISLGMANEIIKIRNEALFASYDDFVIRTKDVLNKKMVCSLAYSGAFDGLNITRKSACLEYDNVIARNIYNHSVGDKLLSATYGNDEYDLETMAAFEKESLGFNLKYDEFIKYQEIITKYNTKKMVDLGVGKNLVVAKVDYINEYNSKSGLMAFLKVSDNTSSHDVTVFASDYERFRDKLFTGKFYLLEIMVNKKADEVRYHLTNLKKL